MSIASLFSIAKTWKQPKCPLTEERINKTWYMYTMRYYLAINKKIMPWAITLMDLEIVILSEVSQKKTNTIRHHFMWNLIKMIQMNLFTK